MVTVTAMTNPANIDVASIARGAGCESLRSSGPPSDWRRRSSTTLQRERLFGPGGVNRARPDVRFYKKENLKIVAVRFARATASASPASIQ